MDERDSTKPPTADVQASDVHRTASGTYRAGHRLGKYVLEGTLGRGGMGLVYRARHVDLDRVVALKVLLPGPELHADDIALFVREAKLLAGLRHPNIVPLHDFDQAEGVHFYTMDLVDGEDLGDRLARGAIPVKRGLEIVRDAARGVAHAHEQGVIHRDLKPGNILLGKDGRVFVTDFGLAKRVGKEQELTASGSMVGTPAYMAPEQAAGEITRMDARTDVYGLGAVMYHTLTGRIPFDGPNLYETLCRVMEEAPARPSTLRPGLARDAEVICMKCLEKEPSRRYADAGELADDIDRFLRGETIVARPAGLAERGWRQVRRRPALVGAIAVLIAGIAVTTLVLSRRFGHELEVARLASEAKYAFGMNDLARASRCAEDAVRIAPDHAAGYFWRARLQLHEYLRRRRLPEVVLLDGLVEFGPPVPETPADAALRQSVLDELTRMRSRVRAGLEGWEEPCALGIVACLSSRFDDAETLLTRALAGGFDLQAQHALALSHFHRQRFADASQTARRLLLTPMDETGRELFVRSREAEGLAEQLRGTDPSAAFDEAQSEAAKLKPPLDALMEASVRGKRAVYWQSRGRAEAGDEHRRAVECAGRAPVSATRADVEGAVRLAYGDWLETHGRRGEAYRQYADAAGAMKKALEESQDRVGLRLKLIIALRRMATLMDRAGRRDERDAAMRFAVEEAFRVLEGGPYLEAHAALLMYVKMTHAGPPTSDELLAAMHERLALLREHVEKHAAGSARAWFVLGQQLARTAIELRDRGRPSEELYREAMAAYDRAMAIHPTYRECIHMRGEVWKALSVLKGARGDDPMPDLERAQAELATLLDAGADDAEAWAQLGLIRALIAENHWRRGRDPWADAERADKAFARCFSIDAEAPRARVARANARANCALWRMQAGQDPEPDFRAALEDVEHALRVDATASEALTCRGMLYSVWAVHDLRQGRSAVPRFGQAATDLRQAAREDTLNTRAMVELARTEYNLGQITSGETATAHLRAALVECDRALQRDARLSEAWLTAAQVYGAFGARRRDAGQDASADMRKSAEFAGRALDINPADVKALRVRAVARVNLGLGEQDAGRDPTEHYEGAQRDVDEALRLNPQFTEAVETRANVLLNRAIWAEGRGRDARALAEASAKEYTRYLDVRRHDMAARYWRAHAWRRAQCWKEAREDFEAVAASASPWQDAARKYAGECKARE